MGRPPAKASPPDTMRRAIMLAHPMLGFSPPAQARTRMPKAVTGGTLARLPNTAMDSLRGKLESSHATTLDHLIFIL
jgi:hypothetical protein